MTLHLPLTGPAVITGGARGLGFSLASALASGGSAVALLDILPEVTESAERLAQQHGVDAVGLRVDVTDQAAVAGAFAEAAERLGTPRVLLTAAGITVWNDSVEVSDAEWRRVMAVNLDGTFFAAQAFGRGLLEAELGGSAVFVASMSGSIVNVPQFQASYNASKAAVAHLARSLAVEWAPAGIRVNSISPGYFLSDMTRQFTEQNPDLARDWTARIPAGRMGEPGDLHGLVGFLASDASAYLTGQDLVIDGGYTAV
ncbi:SDR family oxidoreductase [Leucobacter weissii]|uniref:SDR family oxidoreductase n=1 Tax=Leucobacter weissii TaxID=1983706 RepID=A0A939MLZ2_9MICO|nr:SDR family oxidoreductase [Leucobacter weissii]MBO1901072.1 SDR family oxidoreductase [Leucobacter weissii]